MARAGTGEAPVGVRDERMSATGWLSVSLVAGLAAASAAIVFDLAIAERVIDRAVALEGAPSTSHGGSAVPEPFTRAGQRGGLVAGELLLGAGLALLVAGIATFAAPRSPSPRRFWALTGGAALWGVVVLPALVYPPLPPGVESGLPLGERQLLYLATIAVGVGGFAAAAHLVAAGGAIGVPAALGTALVPAGLAYMLFPDQQAAAAGADLLRDFRAVAIGGQLLFWTTFTLVGAFVVHARAPSLLALRTAVITRGRVVRTDRTSEQ